MKTQNKLKLCLSIAIVIGLVSLTTSYSMKRIREKENVSEESPNLTQYEDIQYVISQKFQQFPEIQNALTFIANKPIILEEQNSLHVATNGNIVATAPMSYDLDADSVKLWDAATGKQLIPIITHPAIVDHIAMSGNMIVTSSRDGTANISKTDGELLASLKFKYEPPLHRPATPEVAIDGNVIAIGLYNEVQIFTIHNNSVKLLKTIQPIKEPKESLPLIKPSIKGNILAIQTAQNNLIQVWDIHNNALLFEEKPEEDEELFKSPITNGHIVVFIAAPDHSGEENKIEAYNIATGELLYSMPYEGDWSSELAISANNFAAEKIETDFGKVISKGIEIRDINTGALLKTINTPNSWFGWSLAMHDNIVITRGHHRKPEIWTIDPLKGTPETNPFLWIINNATVPQLDLIRRAYEATTATVVNKEFIISFPSEDAKVFLSFPKHVKQYLLTRLNIKR